MDFIFSDAYLSELIYRAQNNIQDGTYIYGQQVLSKMLEAYMLKGFAGGYEHGGSELVKALDQVREFAEELVTPDLESVPTIETSPSNAVIPEDVLKYYALYSFKLSGIFDQDVLDKAKGIIHQSIEEGLHYKDVIQRLQSNEEFRNFTENRLKTIALTESTRAYNMGRLEQFKVNSDFVQAVQYSAILDNRTTPLCRSLHGKIIPLDSPALTAYLPPNHFNCRSIVLPVTKYEQWSPSDLSNLPKPEKGFNKIEWMPKGR